MTKLRFHQKTFDYLGIEAKASRDNIAALNHLQQECGITLPPSIVERYAQDLSIEILSSGAENYQNYPWFVNDES